MQIGLTISAKLVSLIEDHQIIRNNICLLQTREHRLSTQRIHTNDQQITIRTNKRIIIARLASSHNPKRQIKECMHLVFPITKQSSRRNNQDTRNQPTRQHLTKVETRHNRFPSSGVVSQQVAQAALMEHMVIDSDALMRKWCNHRNLSCKGGIKEMPISQTFALNHHTYNFWISREINRHSSIRGSIIIHIRL